MKSVTTPLFGELLEGIKGESEEGEGVVIGHNVPKKIYLVRLKDKDNVVEVTC